MAAYKAKNNGLPLYRYNEQQLRLATGLLIEKICFISGVSVGQMDLFEFMQDEIMKFLLSIPAFNRLTIEEIVVAFRMNAAGNWERVDHYNKHINCDYIGKVLENYVKVRQSLEVKELYALPPVDPKALSYEPEYDEDKLLEQVKLTYFATKKVGLISEKAYDILLKKRLLVLTVEQKGAIRKKVIEQMESQAQTEGLNSIRKLDFLKNDRIQYELTVRIACRRQAVADYLNTDHILPNFTVK